MERTSSILFVEDNPDDAFLARIEFEDGDILNDLIHLEDGEEAMRYLRRQPPYEHSPIPGLILLDLHLPRVEGHEILAAVRADPNLALAPIIVVSVPTELEWVQEEFPEVIAGVLAKPIEAQELKDLIVSIDEIAPNFLLGA